VRDAADSHRPIVLLGTGRVMSWEAGFDREPDASGAVWTLATLAGTVLGFKCGCGEYRRGLRRLGLVRECALPMMGRQAARR
jgi:hypothetical protein